MAKSFRRGGDAAPRAVLGRSISEILYNDSNFSAIREPEISSVPIPGSKYAWLRAPKPGLSRITVPGLAKGDGHIRFIELPADAFVNFVRYIGPQKNHFFKIQDLVSFLINTGTAEKPLASPLFHGI
jgi:hypothetical protein